MGAIVLGVMVYVLGVLLVLALFEGGSVKRRGKL
jgi:hypothetical protein